MTVTHKKILKYYINHNTFMIKMAEEVVDLTLPEWGFISDGGAPDPWAGRDVLLHVRSMTIFEFFKEDNVVLKEDVKHSYFWRKNLVTGQREGWVCALHLTTLLSDDTSGMLLKIMEEAVTFFENYLTDIEKETLDDIESARLTNGN